MWIDNGSPSSAIRNETKEKRGAHGCNPAGPVPAGFLASRSCPLRRRNGPRSRLSGLWEAEPRTLRRLCPLDGGRSATARIEPRRGTCRYCAQAFCAVCHRGYHPSHHVHARGTFCVHTANANVLPVPGAPCSGLYATFSAIRKETEAHGYHSYLSQPNGAAVRDLVKRVQRLRAQAVTPQNRATWGWDREPNACDRARRERRERRVRVREYDENADGSESSAASDAPARRPHRDPALLAEEHIQERHPPWCIFDDARAPRCGVDATKRAHCATGGPTGVRSGDASQTWTPTMSRTTTK